MRADSWSSDGMPHMGDRAVQLVDLHGDVVATVPIADGGAEAMWSRLRMFRTDEFGNPVATSPTWRVRSSRMVSWSRISASRAWCLASL